MIYYLCADDQSPSGGRRVSYRHVDILNENGIPAAIMHSQPGYRLNWFENDTQVVSAYQTALGDDDILVFPETRGPQIREMAMGHKYVIFDQNAYYTWSGYTGVEMDTPFDEALGVMCVSDNNREYLDFAFPHLMGRLQRVHISIDHDLFTHVPIAEKKRQVALMIRKHQDEVNQVVHMLKFRNQVSHWQFVVIDNVPESEVACIMRESAVFLEFGYPAGCPVPPLEALACGSFVIGYSGFGADEYIYKTTNFKAVTHADTLNFAKVVEDTCLWLDQVIEGGGYALDFAEQQSKRDADYIKNTYNRQVEADDILRFWRKILA